MGGVLNTIMVFFSLLEDWFLSLVRKSCPRLLHYRIPWGLILSPLLFNIYPPEVTRWGHSLVQNKYHQYADDFERYISARGCPSHVVRILCQCLKAVGIWMGKKTLHGAVVSQILLIHNGEGGILLDWWLIPQDQVIGVTSKAFTQII